MQQPKRYVMQCGSLQCCGRMRENKDGKWVDITEYWALRDLIEITCESRDNAVSEAKLELQKEMAALRAENTALRDKEKLAREVWDKAIADLKAEILERAKATAAQQAVDMTAAREPSNVPRYSLVDEPAGERQMERRENGDYVTVEAYEWMKGERDWLAAQCSASAASPQRYALKVPLTPVERSDGSSVVIQGAAEMVPNPEGHYVSLTAYEALEHDRNRLRAEVEQLTNRAKPNDYLHELRSIVGVPEGESLRQHLRTLMGDYREHKGDDGTSRLLKCLYGKDDVTTVSKMLGGSEAPMLHEAAEEIGRLRAENNAMRGEGAPLKTPDNGTAIEVLNYILACAEAWEPDARILGNLRAGDIVKAVNEALARMLAFPIFIDGSAKDLPRGRWLVERHPGLMHRIIDSSGNERGRFADMDTLAAHFCFVAADLDKAKEAISNQR